MLAARGLGLGTCLTTVANIYEGKVKELSEILDARLKQDSRVIRCRWRCDIRRLPHEVRSVHYTLL